MTQVPTLLGELIGRADDVASGRGDDDAPAALTAEINRVVDPPVAVTADTVFIRTMEVVSDQVNEHGGRFAPEEFDRLCELIVDSPVLVAHDRRQLPVARNFKAVVVHRGGRPWVKVWFYWPKDAAGAGDLASRIDSGVIREVSIGFEFKRPECSVCGADIRECEHRPVVEYRHPDGVLRPAHYLYRDIVRVLETSLVYRGATPGTRIGAGLFFAKPEQAEIEKSNQAQASSVRNDSRIRAVAARLFDVGLINGAPLASVRSLSDTDRFVVSPLIEGLPVAVIKSDGQVFLLDPDRHEISSRVPAIIRELQHRPEADLAFFGWLVRQSGRSSRNLRRSGSEVPREAGERETRRRTADVDLCRAQNDFALLVEWLGQIGSEDCLGQPVMDHRRRIASLFKSGKYLRPLPYRWVNHGALERGIQHVATAGGCRIVPADAPVSPLLQPAELRRPAYLWLEVTGREVAPDGAWVYRLAALHGDHLAELPTVASSRQRYELGRVVRVVCAVERRDTGLVELVDPVLPYTPARRNRPDDLCSLRGRTLDCPITPPAPERRRAFMMNARRSGMPHSCAAHVLVCPNARPFTRGRPGGLPPTMPHSCAAHVPVCPNARPFTRGRPGGLPPTMPNEQSAA